jgi:mRNA-degrading endonuclease RelE of RelBE toxin-antitoxin system
VALTVVYTPRAEKTLNDLDPPDRQRIRRRINAYAADPDGAGHDVVRLVDYVPPLRLRVGD